MAALSTILPLELVDKCTGSPIWVVMKNEREFTGTLMGFDEYVRIKESSLGQTLLNGNNIAMGQAATKHPRIDHYRRLMEDKEVLSIAATRTNTMVSSTRLAVILPLYTGAGD